MDARLWWLKPLSYRLLSLLAVIIIIVVLCIAGWQLLDLNDGLSPQWITTSPSGTPIPVME